MQKFEVKIQRNIYVFWSLILTPLISVFLFVFIILNVNIPISDSLLLGSSFAFMAILIFVTLWIINNVVSVDAEVTLSNNEFKYKLLKKNILYRNIEFVTSWHNILNISENWNPKNNTVFYDVAFKSPSQKLSFSTIKGKESEFEAFCQQLILLKDAYNQESNQNKILDKTIYESFCAKLLTILIYILIPALIGLKIMQPSSISWIKIIGFTAAATAWLVEYHRNKK